MSLNCEKCDKKLEFLEEKSYQTPDGKTMKLCLKCYEKEFGAEKTKENEENKHTRNGNISIAFGILGIISFLVSSYISGVSAIIAIIFGIFALYDKDRYGLYGLMLGIFVIIIAIIITVLVYISW